MRISDWSSDVCSSDLRPGHADYTYWQKYGTRDPRGGGRSSARETKMRVAAAVIAKKWLAERFGVRVRGHLAQIDDVVPRSNDWRAVEGNPFFWPDAEQVPETIGQQSRRARGCQCVQITVGAVSRNKKR